MANPRGFLAESGNSRPKVTVEKRTNTGVLTPLPPRKSAFLVSIYIYIPLKFF